MQALAAKSREAAEPIEAAKQQLAAGRTDDARRAFQEAIRRNRYSEEAYYQLGLLSYRQYVEHEGAPTDPLPPLARRARVFRECYALFRCTLTIDPLYQDAWYQLNVLRTMLPDHPEFLQRSEALSRRAAAFIGEVSPRVDAVDRGNRSGAMMAELSEAFEKLARTDYAIYAAQAALAQGDLTAQAAGQLRARIEALRKTLPADTPANANGLAD
jgi:hypothetical protein